MRKSVRPVLVEGDIAFVFLTKGYVSIIDAADAHLVEGFNWYARVCRNNVYACRYSPRPSREMVHMHRVIAGEPEGFLVDHENGDGLCNRRKNLRAASRAQNSRNQKIASHNSSGFKGVSFDKSTKRFRAYIYVLGKRKDLGSFRTAEEAHKSYCKASLALHGSFGRAA